MIETEENEDKKHVLNAFTQAIRTVCNTKGTSPWEQGGVKSVEWCHAIHNHLKEAQEVSGHPVMEKLLIMTTAYEEFYNQCEEIKSLQNDINEVSEILKKPDNYEELSSEKKQEVVTQKSKELANKKDKFYLESRKTGKNTSFYTEAMENFFKVTNSFGSHLLTHLEVPNMPSTNNETEQFFGKIRSKLRRITGRQNNHSLISTRGDYISITLKEDSYENLKKRIESVAYKDYVEEKNRHSEKTIKPRFQAKFKKDSEGYLRMMLWAWKEIAKNKV